MIGFAAQRLLELEVESLTGAGYGRDRDWETRAGTVELRIPKLRKGSTSLASWSHVGWLRRR